MRALAVLTLMLLVSGCRRGAEEARAPAVSPPEPAPLVVRPDASVLPQPRPNSPLARRSQKASPGPEVCADCHPKEVDGFRATGMGRSLYRPKGARVIEDFSAKAATVVHPRTGVTYRAYVDEEGRWWQEETLKGTDHRFRLEVVYIVGSGNHTRSYIGELEGEQVELPLTWYSRRRIWDMSPGYERADHYRFTRPIKAQCIFCHNDLSPHVGGTLARFTDFAEGITCVRCHGDGTEHVEARGGAGQSPPAGAADPTILNPARLDALGQVRLCQQCHLTGKARVLMPGRRWDHYDPREPLHDFMAVFVPEKDGGPDFSISSHGDRLALSGCFKGSGGKLACTRCHDPHRAALSKARRDACLECHQVEQCGDAHGRAGDDCAPCHMYRGDTVDIPHVTFTDHFIRKRPRSAGEAKRQGVALVDALAGSRSRDDELDREERLAVAHAQVWRFMGEDAHGPEALRRLVAVASKGARRPAVYTELGQLHLARRDPQSAASVYAQAAKRSQNPLFRIDQAQALENLGRYVEAEAVLREAIAARPDYRVAWGNLANVLQRQQRYDDAESVYGKADTLAPHLSITANNRGHNAINRGRFDEAERWFREAVARDGTDPMGRFNQGTLALKRGRRGEARRHFAGALKLRPKFGLAHWLLSRMDREDGDLSAARSHLGVLLQAEPKNPNGYLELARVEHLAGASSRARDVLMRGLLALPGNPALQTALNKAMAGYTP